MKNARVLLIEDKPNVKDMITDSLQFDGHSVVRWVANRMDAFRAFDDIESGDLEVDAIITDYNLEESRHDCEDGKDFTRRISAGREAGTLSVKLVIGCTGSDVRPDPEIIVDMAVEKVNAFTLGDILTNH